MIIKKDSLRSKMPKQVLFIIPSLNYGGAELLMIQQVQWLHSNGWKTFVAILSSNNEPTLIDALGIPESQLLIVNATHSVLNNAAILTALKNNSLLTNFVKENEIPILVAHLPLAHFWARMVKLRLIAIRLLTYHHALQYQADPLNTFGKKVFNVIQKWMASKADDVSVCISEAVKQDIGSNLILKNPAILYNAVPDRTTNPSLVKCNERRGGSESKIRLIIPGRLHQDKGHFFFLNVFIQVIQKLHIDMQLHIAGGGQLKEEIELFIASNKLENSITVTGFLSNEKLLENICESDLVIIPSVSEGLSIVAIEALMLGKTIIASDAGGLKEVIHNGRNGYSFKAGDASDCLKVCLYVLSNFPHSLLAPHILQEDYRLRFGFDSHMETLEALLSEE